MGLVRRVAAVADGRLGRPDAKRLSSAPPRPSPTMVTCVVVWEESRGIARPAPVAPALAWKVATTKMESSLAHPLPSRQCLVQAVHRRVVSGDVVELLLQFGRGDEQTSSVVLHGLLSVVPRGKLPGVCQPPSLGVRWGLASG